MKTVFSTALILLAVTFGYGSAYAAPMYSSCLYENKEGVEMGNWSSDIYYYIDIEGNTLVKHENGAITTQSDHLFRTDTYETREEALKEYRLVLRSLVAQGICPAGALN